MDKEAILNHFKDDFIRFYSMYLADLRPAGKEYKARCPFHDDKTPSLSINPDSGLFHCFGCHISGDIFKFYGFKHNLNGDFMAVLRGIASEFEISINSEPAKHRKEPFGKIVETYDYTNQDGKLLFQVCRMEPKAFRQRRPDGNGGWTWNVKGVEKVLYHLSEVVKADQVWIAEGEKDVDKLRALDFWATTNAGGAGKWIEPYSSSLTGKTVFIIPDNDKPGRDHAARIANSLYGKAVSIKMIELPGLREKGDVSDFIATVGDSDAANSLSKIAEKAVEWIPIKAEAEPEAQTKNDSPFHFIHSAEVLANLRPIEWRIQDVLPDYAFYYNFGDPGHFKTFIELDRLLCIASGLDYHGHKVKQGTVFYICGEGWQGIGRRIAAWHIAHGTRAADVPFFVSRTPTQLMNPEAVQDVRRAVDALAKQNGLPAVVHVDTLARNFGDGDENATRDMNKVIFNLDLAFGNDFCRGLTHHTGHGSKERARGSMALHGAADIAYRVSLTDSGQVKVECKKMKDAPNAPMMLFGRREILLEIGGEQDRSYVLDLAAEGDEAETTSKPKKPAEPKGNLHKALVILRQLYASHVENPRKGGRSCATPSVSFVDWRTACMGAGLYNRTDNFKSAAENLLLRRLIQFNEDKSYVYLPEMVADDDN